MKTIKGKWTENKYVSSNIRNTLKKMYSIIAVVKVNDYIDKHSTSYDITIDVPISNDVVSSCNLQKAIMKVVNAKFFVDVKITVVCIFTNSVSISFEVEIANEVSP